MPHQLYRHFDADGNLLYVGESVHAIYRLSQHMREAKWAPDVRTVTIQVFESRDDAILAETRAIQEERPLYNIKATARRGHFDMDRDGLLKEASAEGIKVDHRWKTDRLRVVVSASRAMNASLTAYIESLDGPQLMELDGLLFAAAA